MTFDISKSLEFDYGHRVWNQTLNTDYSLDDACVCRHLHGHRGHVKVHLSGDTLNAQGMVTDFKHLNVIKKFYDTNVDHKFIIDSNDPLFNHLLGDAVNYLKEVFSPHSTLLAGYIVDMDKMVEDELVELGSPMYENYEGYFVVDFIPTSENLSKWSHGIIQATMDNLNVKVSSIEWWETPKSCSVYSA